MNDFDTAPTMPRPTRSPGTPPAERLEARLGLRLAAALSAAQPALPADVGERLRFARQQALEKARDKARQKQVQTQAQTATSVAPVGLGATAALRAGGSPRQRLGLSLLSLLPLALLAAGLLGIVQWNQFEQARVAAEIDARLLSDPLPPEAYTDPGFAEFLRNRGGR